MNGVYYNLRSRVVNRSYLQLQKRDLSISNNSHDDNSILPVLIVGAGPVGLVLSVLLTKLGNQNPLFILRFVA